MPYKVVCTNDNSQKDYNNCLDAEMAVNRHIEKGHNAYVLPILPSTYESYEKCLSRMGAYNSTFRISRRTMPLKSIPIQNIAKSESLHSDREFYLTDTIPSITDSEKTQDQNRPNKTTPPQNSSTQNPPKKDPRNFYFEKLIKLVPAEIIALYLALHPLAIDNGKVDESWSSWISIICFILVFISRIFGTKVTGYNTMKYLQTAQWQAIFIAAISFIIWIYAIGNEFAGIPVPNEKIVQAAVILWTFIVPILYNGEK